MYLIKPRADGGSSDRSPFGSFWFDAIGRLTGSGARVTADTAMTLPTVFSCVRVLAESFAVMPFVLYAPKEGVPGRGPKIRKHWLFRLFAKKPNRFQSPFEFRLMIMGHLALRGNAFCEILSNGKGEITELIPLHPDRMTVEMLDNGSYRYRYTDQAGKTIYFTRGEIWHLRGLSSDGIMGLSPVDLAREAIGEGLAIQSYSSRFFGNDAKPGGGWIEYPGSFANKDAKAAFRESWQEMQGGANRGKVAVMERGMKFHELGLKNSDAQFIEARGWKVAEVCRIFRVPPHMVADLSRATFSNIESQSIEFWTNTMLPWAELWESSIECFLLGEDVDLDPEFDMRRMMRGDAAARTAYYQGGVSAGWLTRNEARDAEGYDPIDGLDEPLRPLNMVEEGAAEELEDAPGSAAEPAEPAPKPGQQPADAARLQAIVSASAGRLARRAHGALAKKAAAEVFDLDFAALVAEAMGVPDTRAAMWCNKLKASPALTIENIERGLLACANGA